MPRGGGGRSRSPLSRGSSSGFGGRSRAPSYSPPPKPPAQPQHPSMFRQMAATAGGVAAGSLIAGALMGGGRREGEEGGRTDGYNDNDRTREQVQDDDPCALELRNLITCFGMAQESGSDLKMCAGIEKKLIECRQKYGGPVAGPPRK